MLNRLFAKKKNSRPEEEPIIWGSEEEEKAPETTEKPVFLHGIPVAPEALQGHGKIISVQCAKHGDGATTVAVNLAALLAVSSPERVVLIDLDGYGSVRSRLGLPVSECLVNILDWEEVQAAREMAGRMQEHSSGVMVIPGVVHYDHVARITPALVLKILTILKEHFDYIVVDCPPVGVNNHTWAAALVSNVVLTVISPDRTSLDLLEENNRFMGRLGCQERVCAVLNRAGMPGGIRAGDLVGNKKLGINVSAVLPYSVGVIESNNRREIVAVAKRKDDFSQALQQLAGMF